MEAEKHFFEMFNAKEKAMHIIQAGFVYGYYDESIEECKGEYGRELTEEAMVDFENIKHLFKKSTIEL